MMVLIDVHKCDESFKKYSFLIPIISFLVSVVGLWDVLSRIFISIRIPNALLFYFVVYLIYIFGLIGFQKIFLSNVNTSVFLMSYGTYVIFPLWYRLTNSISLSLIICFFHSVVCFRKYWGKKESIVYFIRGGSLILILWKLKELGLR